MMLSLLAAENYHFDIEICNPQAGIRHNESLTIFPKILSTDGIVLLQGEIARISSQANRRDMQIMESQGTWRRMSTIGGKLVSLNSSLIPMIYNDSKLLQFLSVLAGEEVFTVPDQNENHVVNILHREGDLHGAHTDTYAYAFNIVIQAPPLHARGGELEVWFGSQSVTELKEMPAATFRFEPGDAYFLKTDTNLHHIRPIVGNFKRIVLNLAYGNSKTKDAASYSSSQLY